MALVKVKGVLTGPLLRRMLVVRYLVIKRNQLIYNNNKGKTDCILAVTNHYYQYVEKAK